MGEPQKQLASPHCNTPGDVQQRLGFSEAFCSPAVMTTPLSRLFSFSHRDSVPTVRPPFVICVYLRLMMGGRCFP